MAPRLPAGVEFPIDGDLTKPHWLAVPWSSAFEDIRGRADAPESAQPSEACLTRMKMLWDDEYLYIGALLSSDIEVRSIFTARNSPIYQQDSDFEVFVDAACSCHNYKELEVNARNVVWNLLLTRPYDDGGAEHSGRVADPGTEGHYEVYGQRTATRLLSGSLNDVRGATWAVEIALAHTDTLALQPTARRPAVGVRWRINFSRVEHKGATNWVWKPQIVWEPQSRRYEGKVNMHLPDAWGWVQFTDTPAAPNGDAATMGSTSAFGQVVRTAEDAEPSDNVHAAALCVYYAQRAHAEQYGAWAPSLDALTRLQLVDESTVAGCDVRVTLSVDGDGYVAVATDAQTGSAVSITNERHVRFLSAHDGRRD